MKYATEILGEIQKETKWMMWVAVLSLPLGLVFFLMAAFARSSEDSLLAFALVWTLQVITAALLLRLTTFIRGVRPASDASTGLPRPLNWTPTERKYLSYMSLQTDRRIRASKVAGLIIGCSGVIMLLIAFWIGQWAQPAMIYPPMFTLLMGGWLYDKMHTWGVLKSILKKTGTL